MTIQMTTQRVQTTVGTLAVRVEGRGPATVLWHSLFVDDRSWDAFAAPLTGDRQLIRITGPDHGDSDAITRPYSNADCAAAALEVLDSACVEGPVDWVGNAWGGHVGILVAAGHPERVRSLVNLGAPIHAYSSADRRQVGLLVTLYRMLGPVGFIVGAATDTLLSERTRREQPAAVDYVGACLRTADRAGLVNAIRSISLGREDLAPKLPSITAPTLVVTSTDHSGFTPAQAEAAARLLPHGEFALVDGPAYLTPLEAPDASRDLVTAFWSRVSSPAA